MNVEQPNRVLRSKVRWKNSLRMPHVPAAVLFLLEMDINHKPIVFENFTTRFNSLRIDWKKFVMHLVELEGGNMSSDLYTSEIDDDVYGTLCLEMPVHGNLRIIAYDPGNRDLVGCVNLPPNPEGWREAENIIVALQEWMRHTKELEEQKIWAEGFTKGLDR